jgi:uncharacterized membrane protein YfcA
MKGTMAVIISFFCVALVYAMVGFGGGTSYIAILTMAGVDFKIIPVLALICNLVVVSGGCLQFARSEHFKWSLIWPFCVSSVPMALLGGMARISERTFMFLLGSSLLAVALKLLILDRFTRRDYEVRPASRAGALCIGGFLGFLSGMVGIGGGIFLSPLLLVLRWATPKQIAATAAFFILVNSVSGLIGQLSKGVPADAMGSHWPLFAAVLVGGQIGSRLGISQKVSQRGIMDVTAILVLLVSLKTLSVF